MAENRPRGVLEVLDTSKARTFAVPAKRINEGEDVNFWLTSWAYTDLMTFLLQLNAAMFPSKISNGSIQAWTLETPVQYSATVLNLRQLIQDLEDIIQEAPPDPGPRRFGNISFRAWYQHLLGRVDRLLEKYLPERITKMEGEHGVSAIIELSAYLLGSFGSSQRLDYGTGHELSFLAFLGGIWKLGGFATEASNTDEKSWGDQERQIVLGVIEPYLNLVRKLILTYTLEPAGSHGVWGLDDHAFIPYVFGSAQLSPAISQPSDIPQEGSITDAPRPSDVTKATTVEGERKSNMYFAAIGFIYDVKKGPFWEHSPMLFDISGVTAGWAKINKGMIKMYNAEVLSKFPVVQHFPFGSLFRWERNPDAVAPTTSTHTASQPQSRVSNMPPSSTPTGARPAPGASVGTAAPWASGPTHRTNAMPGPKTSWTGQAGTTGLPATRAPWAGATTARPAPPTGRSGTMPATAAPWARDGVAARPKADGPTKVEEEQRKAPP